MATATLHLSQQAGTDNAEPVRTTATPNISPPDSHPLLDALTLLEQASATMVDGCGAWAGLEPLTIRDACTRLRKIRARLDGQVMRASRVLESAGTASATGATSTGAMLASDFGGNRREADALVRTGESLSKAGAAQTERSLLDGSVTPEQAQIISRGLLNLPKDTSPAERERCEEALVDQAKRLSLADLRRAADRATEPIHPPAETDAAENLTVERRERRAWKTTELVMVDQGDGTTTGRFRIPEVQATMLRTLLDAQAAPRRTHLSGTSPDQATGLHPDEQERLTYSQRLGRALCTLIEHVPTDGFATSGGTPASVTITMHLDTLIGGIDQKVAVLGTGTTLSAGQARRMACQHGLIPQVLGGASLPLDRGRAARLFSTTQRQALAGRDLGCAFPGCDRPPAWCEAHHITPYSRGGSSDLRDGVLLCARHHHLVHDDHWQIRLDPSTGHPQFRPPGDSVWRSNRRYRPGDMRGDPPRLNSGAPPPTARPDRDDRPTPALFPLSSPA